MCVNFFFLHEWWSLSIVNGIDFQKSRDSEFGNPGIFRNNLDQKIIWIPKYVPYCAKYFFLRLKRLTYHLNEFCSKNAVEKHLSQSGLLGQIVPQ